MKDYYGIMGLTPEATPEQIKKTYRKLAMELHPDRNPGDPEGEERLKEMNEAYRVLGNEEKRRQYDLFLRDSFRDAWVEEEFLDAERLRAFWALFRYASESRRMGDCRRRGFGKRGCRRWMWNI